MGFLNAMKGANMNFGRVDSPDFIGSYLTTKGDHFMITGVKTGDYEFHKKDVKTFKCIAAGSTWIKYKIVFNDGKCGVITSHVDDPKAQSGGMAPIERFFGDILD